MPAGFSRGRKRRSNLPDFGLTEALQAALKASKEVPLERAGELQAAAREAAAPKVAAVPEAIQAGPTPPPVAVAPSAPEPGAVTLPQINPSKPPTPAPTPAVEDAAASPAAAPSAPDAAGAPPVPVAATEAVQPPTDALVQPQPGVAPANRVSPAPPPEAVPPVQADAQRFVRASLGDFGDRVDMTHMPNTDTMVVPDQLKASILQIADDNEGLIEKARGGVVSDAQLTAMANDLAVNRDTLQQAITQEFGDPVKRPAIALAARTVETGDLGNLYALASKVADGSATNEEIIRYTQAKDIFTQYRTQLAGIGAESGRLQRAFGLPVGLPEEVKDHVASVIAQNNPDLKAEAAAIRLAGTPSGIASIVNGMANMPLTKRIPGAAWGLMQRIFINGILSGPPTWVTIFTGNNTNLVLNTLDLYGAGFTRGVTSVAAHMGRWPSAAEGVALSDAVAYTHGVLSSFADALRVAGRVLKTGQSMDEILRGAQSRAGENFSKWGHVKTADIFPELQNSPFGRVIRSALQIMDTGVDYPGRIIAALDDFTKTMAARGYRTMMSMKELRAKATAGTLKPGDAPAIMQDMMRNPSDEMQQAEEAWAHRITFQTPWPENGAGARFQKVLEAAPVLRFIFPFMRTATNIFKQGMLERNPLLAGFSARLRAQIASGGMEADLARQRILTGTALASMWAWMAIHDRITGAAPKDAKQRQIWEMDGRKEYSVRITNPITGKDTWREYQKFEPIASHVGAVADAVQLMSYVNQDNVYSMKDHDQKLQDAASHIVAAAIQNTGDKTFMQGAAKFAEMWNDPSRAFAMWIDSMGASMVPYSGALKFMRNEQDPYLRNAYTLMDKVRDEIPTFWKIRGSKTLPARPDVFGDPRTTYSGNAVLGPLNPFPGSPSHRDALIDEIQDLMEQTRTVPISMPQKKLAFADGSGSGKGLEGGSGMQLTPEEYAEYVNYARATPIFNGRTFRQELERTMNLASYETATPPERAAMLGNVQHRADRIGAMMLYKNNPEFQARMIQWTAQKNRLKFGQ